jgi:hypothetical protein
MKNEPAFPSGLVPEEHWQRPVTNGMTLRDYFAGQALVGVLAPARGDWYFDEVAETCFAQADAMLAEREKRNE